MARLDLHYGVGPRRHGTWSADCSSMPPWTVAPRGGAVERGSASVYHRTHRTLLPSPAWDSRPPIRVVIFARTLATVSVPALSAHRRPHGMDVTANDRSLRNEQVRHALNIALHGRSA